MESVRKQSSHTSKSFNSSNSSRTPEDFWDFDLPVSRKGRFFQDSSFENSRRLFDDAVKEALNKWGEADVLADKWDDHDDVFSHYRKMQSRGRRQDDQEAMTVTSDDDTAHKIVLDVMDFVDGDVKVKVVGERQLVVEGRLASRTFRRQFSLPPDTDMEHVTSVMSADGILTITAPQKGSKPKSSEASKEQQQQQQQSAGVGGGGSDSFNKQEDHTHKQHKTSTTSSSSSASDFFRDVPFKRRGHKYFDDSFFGDSRGDFDERVRQILREFGEEEKMFDSDRKREGDDLRDSFTNFNRYRKLRARDFKDDNQAFTVTDDGTTHKIVLDVSDFVDDDVKVKVVGERQLVVEGRTEASKGAASSQTFRREFSLPPSTDMSSLTSVMSADGILTITALQKGKKITENEKTIPITVTTGGTTSSTESFTTTSATKESTDASTNDQSRQRSSELEFGGQHKTEEKTTHVKVEAESEGKENLESVKSSVSSDQNLAGEKIRSQDVKIVTEQEEEVKIPVSSDKTSSGSTQEESRHVVQESSRRTTLPITTRGQFFNDSYFESTWRDYQDAVRKVLACWDVPAAVTDDDMTCYRRLRKREMKDENQAVISSEDETCYKFIVDVHDFVAGGEVWVNVEDEQEVVVGGKVTRQINGTTSSANFSRRFNLPHNSQGEDITSVMSSDGVLTVIVPKKSPGPERIQEKSTGDGKSSTSVLKEEKTHMSSVSTQETAPPLQTVIPLKFEDESLNVNLMEDNRTSMKKVPLEKKVSFDARVSSIEGLAADTEQQKRISSVYDDSDEEGESALDAIHRRLAEERSRVQQEEEEARLKQAVKDYDVDPIYKNRLLPIKPSGNFYEDTQFDDRHHQGYVTAVNEVLAKAGEPEGEVAAYRNLRQRDLKLENQAHYADEDLCSMWIVVDVFDFLGGEVTAEVVDGRELIVKGHAKQRKDNSVVTLSFVRKFKLPERADLEAITAHVSTEGVLVVDVPKLRPHHYHLLDLGKTSVSPVEGTTRSGSRLGTPSEGGARPRTSIERDVRASSTDQEGRTYRFSSPKL